MSKSEQLDGLIISLQKAIAGAEYLSKPFFGSQLIASCQEAMIRASSPWLNRNDAAAYWRCSTAEVDAAARVGILTKRLRNGTPMFLKVEGDKAIKSGRWTKEFLKAA